MIIDFIYIKKLTHKLCLLGGSGLFRLFGLEFLIFSQLNTENFDGLVQLLLVNLLSRFVLTHKFLGLSSSIVISTSLGLDDQGVWIKTSHDHRALEWVAFDGSTHNLGTVESKESILVKMVS